MAHDFSTLSTLFDVIESRKGGDPGASYVAGLLKDGKGKIARKLGEEAIESMVAALADGTECEILDLSLSGAEIKLKKRPAVGPTTPIKMAAISGNPAARPAATPIAAYHGSEKHVMN